MDAGNRSEDYVIEVFDDPADIDASAWNALVHAQESPTPFMRHEYLAALSASLSAVPETGWQPKFLVIQAHGLMQAGCPLYLKSHSYGEYVFDWAWADAYRRHGLAYYPKLLNAVPFTPVPGPRLMARNAHARAALLAGIGQLAQEGGWSSAHLLFLDGASERTAREAGWLMRSGVQFHWVNRHPVPYADFSEFLGHLHRDKRKKIQQERRRVREAGISFTHCLGTEIEQEDWDFFYRCYRQTYQEHHSTPYLTQEFFGLMAQTMPENWLLFTAWREGRRVAASLIAVDAMRLGAYGRYWGAVEHVPNLHFEACYYQPLEWCIDHGYLRFEGGAQGEHKMARGLMPVQTWSAHWLAHPQFSEAVADFLSREGEGMAHYLEELEDRKPFKAAP